MNKIIKKITSLVIAFVMIITPALLFNTHEKISAAEGTHSHKACGGTAHEGCTHGDIEFEPYPGDRGVILRGKNYYLTKDIVLGETDRIFVEKGVSNICLNGHSIKKDNGFIIDINNIENQTAELNICDCTGNGRIENISGESGYACISVIDDSTLNLYGGTIDGGTEGVGIDASNSEGWTGDGGSINIYGGAVHTDQDACVWLYNYDNSLSVYGGELRSSGYHTVYSYSDNSTISICGGKIIGSSDSYDTLVIYGEGALGSISGGEVISENFDGIYLRQGALKINGGTVNSAARTAIYNSNGCEVVIDGSNAKVSGGTISSDNRENSAIRNYGTFKMLNGNITGKGTYAIQNNKNGVLEISGGTVDSNKYTLYNLADGIASIKGGSITTTSSNSVWNNGTLDISGGSFSTGDSPTYIINNKQLNLSGSPEFNNTSFWLKSDDNIMITGALTYSAPCPVYIESQVPRVFTSGWSSHMSDNVPPSGYFKSPYGACTVTKSNGEALLRRITLTFDANGGTCNTSDTTVNDEQKASVLPDATREEHSFEGWFTMKDGGDKITSDTVFNSDATLYAHWTKAHVHKWQDTEIIKAPSCTEGGKTLQTCTSCGKTQTINTDSLGGHSFSDTWEYNENSHWKICEICNTESNKETHTWNEGQVITQPSADMDGKTKYTCTLCSAVKEENIPATGGDNTDEPSTSDKGNIIKDVSLSDNVPKTTLTTPLKELISSVLTDEEQEAANSGVNIKIMLTVNDATNNVSAQDKATAEDRLEQLKDYKLGQYLDINLLKIIGGSEGIKITQTNKPITVTFEIPDRLRGKSGYSVIRIHDGKSDVLHDLDNVPDTITIETDKFSTYALAYQEEAPSDNTSDSTLDNSSDNSPTTSSGSNSAVDESNHTPDDNGASDISGNPPTGAAVSLIPLVAMLSGVTFVINRKKK